VLLTELLEVEFQAETAAKASWRGHPALLAVEGIT
jgi:hypothetical protein